MRMKRELCYFHVCINYVLLECKTIIYIICYYLLYIILSNNTVGAVIFAVRWPKLMKYLFSEDTVVTLRIPYHLNSRPLSGLIDKVLRLTNHIYYTLLLRCVLLVFGFGYEAKLQGYLDIVSTILKQDHYVLQT